MHRIAFRRSSTRRRPVRRARRGFTLIEVIVVVTIIALLAGMVVVRLLATAGGATQKIAKTKASAIAQAINLYLIDTNRSQVPVDFDLGVLLLSPDEGGGSVGPYVAKAEAIIDPWGAPYFVIVPGDVNFEFDVVSYGEDGKVGGEGVNADVTH